MSEEYVGAQFITIQDVFEHLGYSETTINKLSDTDRDMYINWTKEGNNNVETDLFPYTDVTPIDPTTPAFSYAKMAALNHVVYKSRDKIGSRNASSAKKDYDDCITRAIVYLKKLPTKRTYPIYTLRTHSTKHILIPYSQTQGFPPNLLY